MCFKKQEIQMTNKLKMIEQELAVEKIMNNDKSNKIKALEEKLKLSEKKSMLMIKNLFIMAMNWGG